MGNCLSIDNIAEDHMHADLICNYEEPQQKYRLGTISNRLLGDLNMFYWIRTLALRGSPRSRLLYIVASSACVW